MEMQLQVVPHLLNVSMEAVVPWYANPASLAQLELIFAPLACSAPLLLHLSEPTQQEHVTTQNATPLTPIALISPSNARPLTVPVLIFLAPLSTIPFALRLEYVELPSPHLFAQLAL